MMVVATTTMRARRPLGRPRFHRQEDARRCREGAMGSGGGAARVRRGEARVGALSSPQRFLAASVSAALALARCVSYVPGVYSGRVAYELCVVEMERSHIISHTVPLHGLVPLLSLLAPPLFIQSSSESGANPVPPSPSPFLLTRPPPLLSRTAGSAATSASESPRARARGQRVHVRTDRDAGPLHQPRALRRRRRGLLCSPR